MPQLDKYIFLNQIVSLTFFFALIYLYIRKDVVPNLSTILKYRRKRLTLFNQQLDNYTKVLNLSKGAIDKKAKKYLQFVSERLNIFIFVYKNKSTEQISSLYSETLNIIKTDNNILEVIIKNKAELKRFDNILK